MTQPPPLSEWDQPIDIDTDTASPLKRASTATWVIGGIMVMFFGSCALNCSYIATQSLETLLKQVESNPDFDPNIVDQLEKVYPLMGPLAITLFVLGALPGMVYLFAGFGIRKGKRQTIFMTQILMITQLIVLGILFISGLAGAVLSGQPAQLTFIILFFGTALAILIYGVRRLLQAKQATQEQLDQDIEPWNQ